MRKGLPTNWWEVAAGAGAGCGALAGIAAGCGASVAASRATVSGVTGSCGVGSVETAGV